jgi:hypothetical protein
MADVNRITSLKSPKYKKVDGSQLVGFIQNARSEDNWVHMFVDSFEVVETGGGFVADPARSISLLTFAGLIPTKFSLGSKFETVIGQSAPPGVITEQANSFFNGAPLKIPSSLMPGIVYRNFEEWTSKKETAHISPWILAALRTLFGFELQSGLEVEIDLPGEPRPGRLDVVALHGEKLISIEAKTTISEAMKGSRFIEQVPKYQREIDAAIRKTGRTEIEPILFLVVGGSEQPLGLTTLGEMNPTAVGLAFLRLCEDYKIRFITANALWQLVARRILLPTATRELSLEHIMGIMNNGRLGLCSSGYISPASKRIEPMQKT